jgi:hypothetical protein
MKQSLYQVCFLEDVKSKTSELLYLDLLWICTRTNCWMSSYRLQTRSDSQQHLVITPGFRYLLFYQILMKNRKRLKTYIPQNNERFLFSQFCAVITKRYNYFLFQNTNSSWECFSYQNLHFSFSTIITKFEIVTLQVDKTDHFRA